MWEMNLGTQLIKDSPEEGGILKKNILSLIRPKKEQNFFWTDFRQPENLFLAICDVLKQSHDDLGLITIKKFFVENGKGIKPMLGYFIQVMMPRRQE